MTRMVIFFCHTSKHINASSRQIFLASHIALDKVIDFFFFFLFLRVKVYGSAYTSKPTSNWHFFQVQKTLKSSQRHKNMLKKGHLGAEVVTRNERT